MYIVSEETKKKMSEAKKGRKYDETHRYNMKVTHIIRNAKLGDYCPVERIVGRLPGFSYYPPADVKKMLLLILDREISDKSRNLAHLYLRSDK